MSTAVGKKPVQDPAFWKQRLYEAQYSGKDVRDSVFQGGNWRRIDLVHGAILGSVLDPRDEVLDAGCGFGRAAPLMLGRRYVGVDISPQFIEIAKTDWKDKYVLAFRDVEFEVGNIADLETEDKTFDWAVCISIRTMVIREMSWQAWDDIRQELLRVTRKGVIVLEYTDPEIYDVIRRRNR